VERSLKFLFLYYHYPPRQSSGVYRNYYLSKAIADITGNALVFTTDNYRNIKESSLTPGTDVRVHQIPTVDYRTLFSSTRQHKSKTAHFNEAAKMSYPIQLLLRVQRSFPFNFLLAEGALLYILASYFKASRLIRKEDVNVIYSSFMPYADHVIAAFLKRKFPQLIWIADFRDLHSEPLYNNTIFRPVQNWFERKILSKADLITCVSDGISKKMKVFGRPVITLTRGVKGRESSEQFSKFTISYTGSMFREFRDPMPLLNVLRGMAALGTIDQQQLEFIYAGKDSDLMEKYVRKANILPFYTDKGLIDRESAMDIQNRSHINLLLTSSDKDHSGLLTGKLFEYFEAGNPILCLVNGPYDAELDQLFTKLNAGIVVFEPEQNISKICDFISVLYQEWGRTGHAKSTINRDVLISEYSWTHQAKMLINEILEKL
jgi:hypothetical protein